MAQQSTPPRRWNTLVSWFGVAVAVLCVGVMAASFLKLIPWNNLDQPDSSWASLTHRDIGPNTAILCGGVGAGFLLLALALRFTTQRHVQAALGPGLAIALGRLAVAIGMIAMASASCLLINQDRTVPAAPPADQLIAPLHGPQLAIAFFLHPADTEGVVVTFPTILAVLIFGFVAVPYARQRVPASLRWLDVAATADAGLIATGVWLGVDRMLPGEPSIPLPDELYRVAIVVVLLVAVPLAYVLLIIELAHAYVRTTRVLWQQRRRLSAGTAGLSGGLLLAFAIAPVLLGLYLALAYEPPSASLVTDKADNLLAVRHPDDPALRMRTDHISPEMRQAIEAIEDPGLLSSPNTHSPVNLITIVGSLDRIRKGQVTGASGLAAQVCKMWTGTPLSGLDLGVVDYSLRLVEKAVETPCAWTLEKIGGADRVLSLYLNMAPFGSFPSYGVSEVRGVEAASRVYFDKSAAELTALEAAMIARLPQNPYWLDPWHAPEDVVAGRNDVLYAMAYRQHYLSPDEAEWYMQQPLGVGEEPRFPLTLDEPFVEQAMGEVGDQGYGGFSTNGSTVTTTLNPAQQAALEGACRDIIWVQPAGGANDCGAVLLHRSPDDPDRFEVSAYVGTLYSISGPEAMPDLVSQQAMPPGSTIKGPLYACALDHGVLEPNEWLDDPGTTMVNDHEIANWDLGSWGTRPASEMLAGSRNVPAAELVRRLTPTEFARCLREQFGVDAELDVETWDVELGMGLAPIPLWELAIGYVPMATGGYLIEPVMVSELTNRHGERQGFDAPTAPRQVIDCTDTAWVTDALLVVGQDKGFPPGVAVKTGSTPAASVVVAYTPDWILAVWVGNVVPKEPLQKVEPYPEAIGVAWQFAHWYFDGRAAPPFLACRLQERG